jgi:hypothetical protein
MLPKNHAPLEEEPGLVSDELLGTLYRVNADGLNELIATVSLKVRALLAAYCYRRAHLGSIGLAIAATCERDDLAGCGKIGAVLFE